MKRYLWLLFLVFTLPAAAQIEEETTEDDKSESIADSTAIDSLARDSLLLPWPQSVQHYVDRLLQADMFETSQVGLMVYDLDADSAIIRFNERQLMRPASTMKVITAIAAIDISSRPNCAIRDEWKTMCSRAISIVWAVSTRASIQTTSKPLSRAFIRWA